MKVGLTLPQYDTSVPGERPLRWPTLARWARAGDDLGFDSLWLSDHLFVDGAQFGYPPGPLRPLDALPALGAVARVAPRARLGTLVLCTPLRPPALVAKAFATLDVLSGGRAIAGLGAGWNRAEFAAAGVPFEPAPQRLRQLAAAIETIRRTWRGEGPACEPAPVQRPAPPIWVGGRGDRLLQVAAGHADGWHIGWSSTVEQFRERSAALDRACARAGRDPASVTRALGLHALAGDGRRDLLRRFERLLRRAPAGAPVVTLDEWRRDHLVGTIDEVREQVEAWAGTGVDELIVNPGPVPFHAVDIDDLRSLAQACSLA